MDLLSVNLMARDELYVMAVSGIYGYHATKTGSKCSLVWMASCFVIPPSVQCRNIGTWDDISDELHRLEYVDSESEHVMPRMLTHADLHSESQTNVNEIYRLSPEPYRNDGDRHSLHETERSFEQDDPIDDYLAEYAQIISSKEEEEEENNSEEYVRPSETSSQTHDEKRQIFARRKSCSDVSKKAGLSFGLSIPKDQTADDFHVNTSQSSAARSPNKPEKFDFKSITAMARRMSIPILDKSEDVDHGTKIYGEKLIKKSRTTKQFREAFSEETDDYIPHRAPKTLSKSLTTSEIENACDELKNEKPGSMKNIVAELKLRGQNYNESRHRNEDSNNQDTISNQKMSKSLTMSEIEKANDDYKIESPVQFRSVVKELQQRSEDVTEDGYHHDESFGNNSLDQSFTGSYTSDSSHTNSLRRNRSDDSRRSEKNNYKANRSSDPVRGYSNTLQSNRANNTRSTEMRNNHTHRLSDSLRDSQFSKTLPANFDGNISGASTPRNYRDEHNSKINSTRQKSEEPASDLMKKLNNLTAQTRMATRPSLGNIEGYEPSSSTMMRSQSVMNVSSPLSPRYDRNPLSSSLSSSASSSSDIPAISYHSVVDPCHRCWKTVYSLDKVGPIRKVQYHKQCFRCVTCNTMLSLNTYKQNVNDKSDVQVYCKKHVPTLESPHIDLEAKNLNVMMHHPKLDSVNTNIRGGTLDDKRKSRNLHPLSIGRAVSTPRLDLICGPNDNSESYDAPCIDKNGNVSLRELKMDDTPRSVWSRSTFSAAKLDLTVPASARTGSSLYRTVDTWNYL